MSDIIDFSGRKISGGEDNNKPRKGIWRFHIYPQVDGSDELDIQEAEGFIKFGPLFTAVTETNEDTSAIIFACATPTIKYVRRLD